MFFSSATSRVLTLFGFLAVSVLVMDGPAATVMILHTSDTQGVVEECECSVPGGAARMATVLRDMRDCGECDEALVITAHLGHFMMGPLTDEEHFNPGVLRVLSAVGFDVAVLGPQDVPAPEMAIEVIEGGLAAQMLSLPIELSGTWPVAQFEHEGLTVGVLGWPADRLDPIGGFEELAEAASVLAEESDFVVLLSPLTDVELRPELESVDGIDAVVCRRDERLPMALPEWDRGRIWSLSSGSEEVGCLRIDLDEEGAIEAFSNEAHLLVADVEQDPGIVGLVEESMFFSQPTVTQDVEPESEIAVEPGLHIESHGLIWDEVEQGTVFEATVTLRNGYDRSIGVRNVRTTCRCVHIGEWESEIEAGGEMVIPFTVDTTTREGDVDDLVIISTRDRRSPIRTLPIRGRVTVPEAASGEGQVAAQVTVEEGS